MSHILQNVKSGFANMSELFGIFLRVDENSDSYDLYINGKDTELSQIAEELKVVEEQQESNRLSLFTARKQRTSSNTKVAKKNFKSNPSAKGTSVIENVSKNERIREEIEPEK